MEYLVNMIIIIIFCYYLIIKRDYYSPVFLFMLIWTTIITLYNTRFIALNRIDDSSWLIILVGIVSFLLGYSLMEVYTSRKISKKDVFAEEYINYNYLIILAIITILLLIPLFVSQFQSFLTTFDLNQNKTNLVLQDATGVGVVYQYISRPLQLIMPMLASVIIFKKNPKSKIFVSLCIVILFIEFISGGIKQNAIFFVLYIFLVGKFLGISSIKNKSKLNKKIIILGTLLVCVILYFMSTYTNLIESLYLYVVGCIPLFEQAIKADYFLSGGYVYGFSAFQGLFRVAFKLLNTIGLFPPDKLLLLGDKYRFLLETGRNIGEGHMFNSMGTVFYNFYYDGGIIAVVLGMFLFGFVSAKLYDNVKRNNSTYNLLIYVFLIYFVINVEARFEFYSVIQAMGYIFIIILIKPFINKKIKISTKRNE